VAVLGAAALALGACTTGASPTPSPAPATSAPASQSSGASEPASATPAPTAVTGNIGIGYPSEADAGDTPSILAINTLNQNGWQIKPTFFAQPETDFAAVSKGDIQIAIGSSSAALLAIQAGGKFHVIGSQEGVAWLVIGTDAVQKCDDIVGKRWALHSPAGVTTGYANFWISNNCSADAASKIQAQVKYIPGSENREAALLAGQIDATLLDTETWADLDAKAPGKYHVIGDLASDPTMKKLNSSIISVNDQYWNDHPEVVVAYLKGMMDAYTKAKADPTVLDAAAASQHVQWNDTIRTGVAKEFAAGALDPTLSVTPDGMELNIQFYTKYSGLKPGLTVDQSSWFDPLKQASGS
jgi:ABC-type nitrate/sulfonate/bicarbonate transport system substrate-binding protein